MSDLFNLPQTAPPTTASYWPGAEQNTYDGPTAPSPYKRSGKSQRDLLKCYCTRTTISKKWRYEKYDKTWRRLIDLYRGKQVGELNGEDHIVINVCFSTVNVIVPSLAVNDPKITVNARLEQEAPQAEMAEAAVNYWWRTYGWKHEVKRSVKDMIGLGHGWVKVGWKYSEKTKPTSPEEQAAQYADLQQQVQQAAMASPALAADLPSDDDIYDQLDQTKQVVHLDHPFCERVSPLDMFIDPEATYYGDLKWLAQRIVAPLAMVKADSRYDAAARNELGADMSSNPRWRDTWDQDRPDQVISDDIQRVTLWEYWDLEHDYYCVFSDKGKKFLLAPTDNPYPFKSPFFFLPNYEVTDQFYPLGDLEMIEPIQLELNGVRSDMMNHRKRWQRAYLYLRDKLTPDALAILDSNEDGRLVPVDGDEDLDRIVRPIGQVSLDPQMYQYSQQVENDLDLVSGVTEYDRGSAPEIRRTATEASMLQSASNARVSDKLATVEQFMADIAEAVIQLAQMFMTQEEAAMIAGPDGAKTWVQFTPEQIQGKFDFTVEAGSTQPKDENFKRQQAMQLFQTLQPFVGTDVDPRALVTYVLRDGFGVKNPDQFLMQQAPPGPSPMQKIIETLNYKDLPEDIKRQAEQQAGFKPSTIGSPQAIDQAQSAQQQADQQAHEQQMSQQEHDQALQQQAAQAQYDQQQQAQQAPPTQ